MLKDYAAPFDTASEELVLQRSPYTVDGNDDLCWIETKIADWDAVVDLRKYVKETFGQRACFLSKHFVCVILFLLCFVSLLQQSVFVLKFGGRRLQGQVCHFSPAR